MDKAVLGFREREKDRCIVFVHSSSAALLMNDLSSTVTRSNRSAERIERAIRDQRAYIHRVPDPDTRERAEGNLYRLIQMRDAIVDGGPTRT